jgi:hypothetical protein
MEASVELSSKEAAVKKAEQQHRAKTQPTANEDSPVENLLDAFNRKKDSAST